MATIGPATRGWISTRSIASTRPEYSFQTIARCALTVATETFGAGGASVLADDAEAGSKSRSRFGSIFNPPHADAPTTIRAMAAVASLLSLSFFATGVLVDCPVSSGVIMSTPLFCTAARSVRGDGASQEEAPE